MKKFNVLLAGVLTSASLMQTAAAAPLRSGYGGVAGYGELTQLPNDDGSSNRLSLPFELNFFGQSYNQFFVNNNGNISFNSALSTFTPRPFPIANQPIIAPYWADVDTRTTGAVYSASPDANTVVLTWNNVGYYDRHNDKINDFQMTLFNRADTGDGNFDVEFRYNKLEWTTGDVSGGTAAQAGYDAGDQQHYFTLPGSLSGDVLNLVNTSNVSESTPGVWTMAIRNGALADGSSAAAPLMPTIVTEAGYEFNFNIALGQQIFIDPVVAVGYEYRVSSGPNITSALVPVIAGDSDGYEIYSLDNNLLGIVLPGALFDFGPVGVDGFRLTDIEAGAGLDPNNPSAFVTGLTFAGAGPVTMTQLPLTQNTGTVPEPGSLALLLLGATALGVARRKRQAGRL